MTSEKPLRILHVASHHGMFRGGAVQMFRMAEAQRARGHKVTVVFNRSVSAREWGKYREKNVDEGKLRESWAPLREAGLPVVGLKLERSLGRLGLRWLVRLKRIDVVHAHRDEALVAAWEAMQGLRRPILAAQRGTISRPPRKKCEAFRSARVDVVIAVAEAVKAALGEHLGDQADKIEVVYGSVNLDRFKPRPPALELKRGLDIPDDARVIGSLSAFRRGKGFELLLEAARPAFERERNVYLVFLGLGVEENVAPLAREMGIGDRCRFVGHQADVAGWLSIMDVTLVTASSREGLSGVLRESLAMEIPVISTDCAGNREIVRDRETGLLVPTDDAAALSEALGWALDKPEAMKRMARAGREWVERHCSTAVQAERLEAIYRKALAKRRGSGR